jgi:DNA-binding CsgD family transcriptional regulator
MTDRLLLTPRQTQVAVLVAQGYGYKDIGRELRISHHTVRALVVQITNKIPDDGRTPLRRLMLWMLADQEPSIVTQGAA